MEQILINLITGALGGVGAGKASPTFDLGMIGNIISGLVGGGVLGQIVTLLLPAVMAAAQSGNLSIGGIISQAIAGGAGGAILTAIIGAIKNKAAACSGAISSAGREAPRLGGRDICCPGAASLLSPTQRDRRMRQSPQRPDPGPRDGGSDPRPGTAPDQDRRKFHQDDPSMHRERAGHALPSARRWAP